MIIQVILGQVREQADIVIHALHAKEIDAMGRDFHCAIINLFRNHLAENFLQIRRLWRGVFGFANLSVNLVIQRPDQTGAIFLRQNAIDNVGGRGFAVGAGDADHFHFF